MTKKPKSLRRVTALIQRVAVHEYGQYRWSSRNEDVAMIHNSWEMNAKRVNDHVLEAHSG